MEVLAKGKYIKTSPKKARPVADLVRGKNAIEAKIILDSLSQAAASEIKKVLDSAIANAENNFNLEKSELKISKIMIDGGPVVKRYMPRAQGRASEIKRRTSHIEIILSGEIKTKKKAIEKEAKTDNSTENNKNEIEAQKSVEIDRSQEKFNVKGSQGAKAPKIFRRKTG